MPASVTPTDPTWRLDVAAFEATAAQFLKTNGITTDAQRAVLVNAASTAQIAVMVQAFFNCVKTGP